MMIKTFSKIVFMIPVSLLAMGYLLLQKLKGKKSDNQKCRIFLMNNTILIGLVAKLFWGTIIILTIKLFA